MITAIIPDMLYLGNEIDYKIISSMPTFKEQYSFVGAAKYPWHKSFARMDGSDTDGYTSKAMPKDQKEYLYAQREHALYCNLIDVQDPKYISEKIIDVCIEFISSEIKQGRKVLICCNKGESRSPSIALIFMLCTTDIFNGCGDTETIIDRFKREFYPLYNPSNGMLETVRKYANGKKYFSRAE